MKSRILIAVLALAALVGPSMTAAQEPMAEVRTWSGQSWRLAGPSLQVSYDVFEKAEAGGLQTSSALPPPSASAPLELRGSVKALSTFLQAPPQSRLAQREAETVTIVKESVETRVLLASIDTMRFIRQPVAKSELPPYIAASHIRHSVIVVLRDGSRLEGDYVNWGTAILRGTTPHGRVDIPWAEIEMVRFVR